MGSFVFVYAVPVDRLRAAPGSRDTALLNAARELQGFFATIDELGENREEKPPTCAEAFAQIVNGGPYAAGCGYVYGYAYEALCAIISPEAERCWPQIAGGSDWFAEIDEALAVLGVKLRVTDLLYRGALINIPEPDDAPGLGWWSADEVVRAAEAFESFELRGVGGQRAKAVEQVINAVEDVRSWVTSAAGRPGVWLVGVHS